MDQRLHLPAPKHQGVPYLAAAQVDLVPVGEVGTDSPSVAYGPDGDGDWTEHSSRQLEPVGIWDREDNDEAWRAYPGGESADQYAAPARANSLEDLPPVFLDVGDNDLFRDEVMLIAHRLTQAGVPTEFHLYPGAFHASEEVAPNAALSQLIMATRYAALRRALLGDR